MPDCKICDSFFRPVCGPGILLSSVLYATSKFQNIIAGGSSDFDIQQYYQNYTAYDLGSIMHYNPSEGSANGLPTFNVIVPIPPGVVVGQRVGVSAGDIAAIQAMYPIPAQHQLRGPVALVA